jgi:hypothetical protein
VGIIQEDPVSPSVFTIRFHNQLFADRLNLSPFFLPLFC